MSCSKFVSRFLNFSKYKGASLLGERVGVHSVVWGEVLQCHFLNKIYGRRPKEYYLKYTCA